MRFRFSLKTFLIGVTLLALLAGAAKMVEVDIRRRAERHLAILKEVEGVIHVNNDSREQPTRWELFARQWIHPQAYPKAWSAQLHFAQGVGNRDKISRLKEINGLQAVNGFVHALTLDEAKHISAIPNLKRLQLRIQGTAEEGALAVLFSAPKLEQIFISSELAPKTADTLASQKSLVHVLLEGDNISPECFERLSRSLSIEHLSVYGPALTAEHLAPLKQMQKLKRLDLHHVELTAEAVEALAECSLTDLSIISNEKPIGAITPLSRMKSLKELGVHSKSTTPVDVASFANCPNLQRLELTGVVIDPESLRALKNAPLLKSVVFAGSLADNEAQAFVDAAQGRRLTLFPDRGKPHWVNGKSYRTSPKAFPAQ